MSEASTKCLSGRAAIVSGASRGIGRAIALRFAEEGARLGLIARDEARLAEVAAAIAERGGEALARAVDVRDAAAADEAVRELSKGLGGLDILVNNAGVTRDGLVARMKDEDWAEVLETNLGGAFRLTRPALRALRKSPHARIINISSVVGLRGQEGQANYAASKAGLIGLTRALARELAPWGITVNAIAPGFVETDMTAGLSAELRAAILAKVPMRRLGTPDDVAHAALFLAGDGAAYITGATLQVDGGLAI